MQRNRADFFSERLHRLILPFCLWAILSVVFLLPSRAQTDTQPLIRFGVVADVQYADIENSGTRYYRLSPGKLAEAVAEFNRSGVDFVMSLGDFINDEMPAFDTLNAITADLEMPLFHVAGNHDFDPVNPDQTATLKAMGLSRLHYSFRKPGWRFVALNGNDISLYAHRKGTAGNAGAEKMIAEMKSRGLPNANPWNGAVGPGQMKWLEKELKQARRKGEKVILTCHFPVVSGKAGGLLLNAEEVISLMAGYPHIFAYLCGHGHISEHAFKDGIHHVMFSGMVELDTNAFAIVSVYENHIEIEGFGREVDRVLK